MFSEIKEPRIILYPEIRSLIIREVKPKPQSIEVKPLDKTKMNLLDKMLNCIGDKGVHYSICLMFSLIITLIILLISGSYWSGILSGLYAGTGLGIGKEYGDMKAHGNYWSWGDILADMLGTISGTAITAFIYWVF